MNMGLSKKELFEYLFSAMNQHASEFKGDSRGIITSP